MCSEMSPSSVSLVNVHLYTMKLMQSVECLGSLIASCTLYHAQLLNVRIINSLEISFNIRITWYTGHVTVTQ